MVTVSYEHIVSLLIGISVLSLTGKWMPVKPHIHLEIDLFSPVNAVYSDPDDKQEDGDASSRQCSC